MTIFFVVSRHFLKIYAMKLLSPLKEQNQDIEVQYERIKPQTTNISEEYLTSAGKRDYQKQYVIQWFLNFLAK